MIDLNYFYGERLTHGVKTALACLIGFGITRVLHFYVDQWLIITIIVVMCAQISVGSMIQKSYMRFLGTLAGSIIAGLTLYFFNQNETAFAIVIAVSVMIFSYIATSEKSFNESGTLGAVTIVIILISQNPTLTLVLERFMEISAGILIATLVSQFVLPMHASKHLRDIQATTLRQLRAFYLATLKSEESKKAAEKYLNLDESIALSLIKQRKLATDSARELFGGVFNQKNFQELLQSEKEILRCIAAMHHIYELSPYAKALFTSEEMQKSFHVRILAAFENISVYIERSKTEKNISLPDVETVKKCVYSKGKNHTREEQIYLDAYLFSAETLIAQLNCLCSKV